jgi:hypothetical protein
MDVHASNLLTRRETDASLETVLAALAAHDDKLLSLEYDECRCIAGFT